MPRRGQGYAARRHLGAGRAAGRRNGSGRSRVRVGHALAGTGPSAVAADIDGRVFAVRVEHGLMGGETGYEGQAARRRTARPSGGTTRKHDRADPGALAGFEARRWRAVAASSSAISTATVAGHHPVGPILGDRQSLAPGAQGGLKARSGPRRGMRDRSSPNRPAPAEGKRRRWSRREMSHLNQTVSWTVIVQFDIRWKEGKKKTDGSNAKTARNDAPPQTKETGRRWRSRSADGGQRRGFVRR